MATFAFGVYLFVAMVVYSFLAEIILPKITRKNCNDAVDPLWPVR